VNMPAILVETRSVGGMSGSPVFVHMGFTRWREDRVQTSGTDRPFFFLGLIHGHWTLPSGDTALTVDTTGGEPLNVGISIVVPAENIMRTLEPLREALRAEMRRIVNQRDAATEDSVADGSEDEFARFRTLAQRLLAVPKSEVDEQRETT
jgi:hypothetical protein